MPQEERRYPYVNNTYRIKRSAAQQEAMQRLTNAKVFDSYKDILMVSAIIGVIHDKYVPIEKVATDGVLMQFFTEKDYDIIDLIAYSHAKTQNIVKQDEKYTIFESYANGGFPILLENLNATDDAIIDVDNARKMLKHYYALILSNGFIDSSDITNEDLLI